MIATALNILAWLVMGGFVCLMARAAWHAFQTAAALRRLVEEGHGMLECLGLENVETRRAALAKRFQQVLEAPRTPLSTALEALQRGDGHIEPGAMQKTYADAVTSMAQPSLQALSRLNGLAAPLGLGFTLLSLATAAVDSLSAAALAGALPLALSTSAAAALALALGVFARGWLADAAEAATETGTESLARYLAVYPSWRSRATRPI